MGSDVTFVLFLDDDISVHPGTVQLLVGSMRDRPEVRYPFSAQKHINITWADGGSVWQALVVTGYPFDIPSRSFFSYCVMAFHLARAHSPPNTTPYVDRSTLQSSFLLIT